MVSDCDLVGSNVIKQDFTRALAASTGTHRSWHWSAALASVRHLKNVESPGYVASCALLTTRQSFFIRG